MVAISSIAVVRPIVSLSRPYSAGHTAPAPIEPV